MPRAIEKRERVWPRVEATDLVVDGGGRQVPVDYAVRPGDLRRVGGQRVVLRLFDGGAGFDRVQRLEQQLRAQFPEVVLDGIARFVRVDRPRDPGEHVAESSCDGDPHDRHARLRCHRR